MTNSKFSAILFLFLFQNASSIAQPESTNTRSTLKDKKAEWKIIDQRLKSIKNCSKTEILNTAFCHFQYIDTSNWNKILWTAKKGFLKLSFVSKEQNFYKHNIAREFFFFKDTLLKIVDYAHKKSRGKIELFRYYFSNNKLRFSFAPFCGVSFALPEEISLQISEELLVCLKQ